MSSVLDSLASAFSPDVLGSLGKALGTDGATIGKGLGVADPLALAGMARLAARPGGSESLMKLLPQDGGSLLGSIGSLLGGVMGGGGSGPSPVSALLGPGANAIGAQLSRALGFNVTPLLGLVVPAALSAISKLVKSQNLDASGVAALLNKEHGEVADDPARREAATLVDSALQTGEQAAATIASYGAEWSKVVSGPVAAMFAVATSDLSGPWGSIKEAQAAGKALQEAGTRAAPASVLAAAFGGGLTPDMARDLKTLAPGKGQLLDVVRAGFQAVRARSPDEAAGYRETILAVATATAEAAKERGFLGIGGTQVSQDEQAAIEAIKAALN